MIINIISCVYINILAANRITYTLYSISYIIKISLPPPRSQFFLRMAHGTMDLGIGVADDIEANVDDVANVDEVVAAEHVREHRKRRRASPVAGAPLKCVLVQVEQAPPALWKSRIAMHHQLQALIGQCGEDIGCDHEHEPGVCLGAVVVEARFVLGAVEGDEKSRMYLQMLSQTRGQPARCFVEYRILSAAAFT